MARHPNGRFVVAVNMDSNVWSVIGLQDLSTSISSSELNDDLRSWPVPAHDLFRFCSSGMITRVRLLDQSGREVRRWQNPSNAATYDLDGVGAGLYHVEVSTQHGVVTRKLVVQ